MDQTHFNTLLKDFTLNQRSIVSQYRKAHGLNRTHLEILTFAKTVTCFNLYEAHKQFVEMNMQQIRLGIKKMAQERYIEVISFGIKGHPAVYMITIKGKDLLENYSQYWQQVLSR